MSSIELSNLISGTINGFTGSVGFTGSQGLQGFTGSIGPLGYTGSQGIIGFTGSQGNKNVDGGNAFSTYLTSQTVNGGSANG